MALRIFISLQNVQALATLPAGASVETAVEVLVTRKLRRNGELVGVAQPRLVRRCVPVVDVMVMLCYRRDQSSSMR
jgi:hypothetical protein